MHFHLLVSAQPGIIHFHQLARGEDKREPSDKSTCQRLKDGSSARRREIKMLHLQVEMLSEKKGWW